MMNGFDLLLIVLMGYSGFKGLSRGLIGSLLQLGGYLLSLWAASMYYRPAASWLDQTFHISGPLKLSVQNIFPLPPLLSAVNLHVLPKGYLDQALGELSIPLFLKDHIGAFTDQLLLFAAQQGIKSLGTALYAMLAQSLLNGLVFFFLWLLLLTGISSLVKIISAVMKFTPLGLLDKGWGLLTGLVFGATSIAVTLGLLYPVLSWGVVLHKFSPSGLYQLISSSTLLPYFLDYFNFLKSLAVVVFSGNKTVF